MGAGATDAAMLDRAHTSRASVERDFYGVANLIVYGALLNLDFTTRVELVITTVTLAGIVSIAAVEIIDAIAAHQGIVTIATIEIVGAGVPFNRVVTIIAVYDIVVIAAFHAVISGTAVKLIGVIAAVDRVSILAAKENVFSAVTVNLVLSCPTIDDILIATTLEIIVARIATDDIVAKVARDGIVVWPSIEHVCIPPAVERDSDLASGLGIGGRNQVPATEEREAADERQSNREPAKDLSFHDGVSSAAADTYERSEFGRSSISSAHALKFPESGAVVPTSLGWMSERLR
jgi:hypothetical protein